MPLPKAPTYEQSILKYLIKQPNRTATIKQLLEAAGDNFPLMHILVCMLAWVDFEIKAPEGIELNYKWGKRENKKGKVSRP